MKLNAICDALCIREDRASRREHIQALLVRIGVPQRQIDIWLSAGQINSTFSEVSLSDAASRDGQALSLSQINRIQHPPTEPIDDRVWMYPQVTLLLRFCQRLAVVWPQQRDRYTWLHSYLSDQGKTRFALLISGQLSLVAQQLDDLIASNQARQSALLLLDQLDLTSFVAD